MTTLFSPPFTPPDRVARALRDVGHATLTPEGTSVLVGVDLNRLDRLRPSWDNLPPDAYLRDGGRYRRRRHASFVIDTAADTRPEATFDTVTVAPHRAHWQPVDYNALHGGIERWFEPIEPAVLAEPAWTRLLAGLARICSEVSGARPWFVEAHQFRIDTTGGIGRPTPEGAHRDGVDFVAVLLVDRRDVKGGETRVFEAHGSGGQRFTLTRPWSCLLLDDRRVVHETTPIQPLGSGGHRDTLVLTFRADGFQAQTAA